MTAYPWTEPTVAAPFPAMEYYGANPPPIRLMMSNDRSDVRTAEASRLDHDGFLTMTEATAELGICKSSLSSRVRRANVPTFADALDWRVRLLRREDVERLMRRGDLNDAAVRPA